MAAFSTAIAAVGLGVAAAGAYTQYQGAQASAKSSQEAIAVQQRQEALRRRQMNLEAMRRQREVVRQGLQARSMALATTTAQGASGAGGSALPGAYGQISGRTNTNSVGINTAQQAGNEMFGLNTQLLGAYRGSAAAASTTAIGAGLSSMGNALMSNAVPIGRVGTYVAGKFA
jgi:hypothetical protein